MSQGHTRRRTLTLIGATGVGLVAASFGGATDDHGDDDDGDFAAVRAAHLSPDAPNVDVSVEGGETVLFEDVAFGEADALEVPAGDYALEVVVNADGYNGDDDHEDDGYGEDDHEDGNETRDEDGY